MIPYHLKLTLCAATLMSLLWIVDSTVHASVVQKLTIEQLLERADHVIVATPFEKRARWNARRQIVTDVKIRIAEVLKGRHKTGTDIVITRLGGELDDIAMRVDGAARLVLGQTAVMFLREVPQMREIRVVGMSQGILPLQQQVDSVVVLPGGQGQTQLDSTTNAPVVETTHQTLTTPLPADQLLNKLRRLLATSHAN
jgi:hypothetical protein